MAIAVARRGAYVGFDRVTIQLVPDAQKVTTIRALLEAGHGDRLLISSDFSSPRGLKKNGGGGLGQAVTVFAPLLGKPGSKRRCCGKFSRRIPSDSWRSSRVEHRMSCGSGAGRARQADLAIPSGRSSASSASTVFFASPNSMRVLSL